mgnify:CR=1 FL=1
MSRESLEDAVVVHHARFLAFVRSKVESDEAAEDILHAAYGKGLEKARGVKTDDKVVAWFYRLLRNAIIDHYRHRAVETRTFSTANAEAETVPDTPDQEMEKAICACMADLVKTLKPEYADAIKTVELGEQDLGAYSKARNLTRNNATVRLHRARQSLKKRLVQTCGSCAAHGCLDCNCR